LQAERQISAHSIGEGEADIVLGAFRRWLDDISLFAGLGQRFLVLGIEDRPRPGIVDGSRCGRRW